MYTYTIERIVNDIVDGNGVVDRFRSNTNHIFNLPNNRDLILSISQVGDFHD